MQDLNISAPLRSAPVLSFAAVAFMTVVRAVATLSSSLLFAIVAAPAVSAVTPVEIGLLAFGYLSVFMLGAAYRVFINAWQLRRERVSPTWSGATAVSAAAITVAALVAAAVGGDPEPLLLGYALAITAAFVLIKQGCLAGGCCAVRRFVIGVTVDLRHLEIIVAALILGVTALCATTQPALAAALGLVAFAGLRVLHHRWLRPAQFSWLPLQRPGIELIPLYAASGLAIVLLVT